MVFFRRKEAAWEVVDSESVDPVPMYYDDDDLDVTFVKDHDIHRNFVVEVKDVKHLRSDLPKALVFAREQLLEEIKKNGYNVLLLESWSMRVLRKAKTYRVEVEYSGRPAIAVNTLTAREPPFMNVIASHYPETHIPSKLTFFK